MHKTLSSFSGGVILRNRPLKFPVPIVWDLTGCRNAEFSWGKCLKINQKIHGGDRRHIKVRKKIKILKSTDGLFFIPMPNPIVHISK